MTMTNNSVARASLPPAAESLSQTFKPSCNGLKCRRVEAYHFQNHDVTNDQCLAGNDVARDEAGEAREAE